MCPAASENAANAWLIPSLNGLLHANGFAIRTFRGHNRTDLRGIGTGPTWIERGTRILLRRGQIGPDLAIALNAECQRRIDARQFYATLPFATAVATRL